MKQREVFTHALLALLVCAASALPARAQSAIVKLEGWDISTLDSKIAEAAAKANKPGASIEEKREAAGAYLKRASFFYSAGRASLYKLALGDFRRVLRFQPDNAEAREKMDLITSIYKALDRSAPENGSETDMYNDPNARYAFKPEKISLPSDKNSITLSETLQPGVTYVYELNLRTGQRISMNIKSDNDAARFAVLQGRQDVSWYVTSAAKEWDTTANEEQDFLIKISSTKEDTTYKLKVRFQ